MDTDVLLYTVPQYRYLTHKIINTFNQDAEPVDFSGSGGKQGSYLNKKKSVIKKNTDFLIPFDTCFVKIL